MGTFFGKLTGKKVREKSETPSKNVISDKKPVPSPTNVRTLPPIRYAKNENIKHEGRVKLRKKRSYVTPSDSSEVKTMTASTNAEEVKRTSERQSYNGEQKQQDHKVKEGIGSHNSQIRNTDTKTSFLHVEARKDFQDENKKRECDTANLDGRDTLSQSKDDTKNSKERPRTTSSVRLEEGALHERIMSAKCGRSNDQGTDFEAVKQTQESDTARFDVMSNMNGSKKDTRKDFLTARNDNEGNTWRSGNSARDGPIKDPGPSHSRNEADEEKGNRSLNAEPCNEDRHKNPIKKDHKNLKIKELEDQVKQVNEEKNVLLNRLSEIGAMKLIDNNPNITDLSDANRPEKLVEQLSELYDNEWTDAYEHLTKTQSKPMDQSVNLLLQVLKEAYKICLSSTNKRAMKLRKAILSYVGLSDEDSIEIELQEIEKKIYEYRTKKSQSNVTRVGKEVRERLRDQFKQLEIKTSKSVSLYIDGCVRICWYMCIKNPPMHLDFGENEKTTTVDNSKPVVRCFDKTKFMCYTKHGDYIDFVVWPAVFLHCGGSIMRKGVAQGAPVATNMLLDVMDEN